MFENTIVKTYGTISDRDDIIRDFDWREILVPTILSTVFILSLIWNEIVTQNGNARIAEQSTQTTSEPAAVDTAGE